MATSPPPASSNPRSLHPGDLDLIVYSLREWMRLALTGNPTVLLPLFVAGHEIVRITELGHELRANATKIVSRQAGLRFAGYLRTLVRGGSCGPTARPEVVSVEQG
ncbi:nucleotidyltransferase domain-containing protein [Amycolatopsis sp. NBC_01488]|uniref:DNA polymerase beta superfamily protein n=1 Tax=Amycolatopsis sp. NBC_01488 TaxID=2903563 RepID=UPI002E28BAB5|nr:nucleotidyltransferase domain-containing protein [Amycolatopsis sp. NBC_01488]